MGTQRKGTEVQVRSTEEVTPEVNPKVEAGVNQVDKGQIVGCMEKGAQVRRTILFLKIQNIIS